MDRPPAPASSPTRDQKVSKLRDMLGITVTEASNVLEVCKQSLEQATELLYSSVQRQESGFIAQETGGMEVTQATRSAGDGAGPATVDSGTGTVADPIDLTKEDDALQKALALSIQDMQGHQLSGGGPEGVSIEDQELSRALEASIRENQVGLTRLGLPVYSVFIDPLNPHERKRADDSPVGLKNIGNTCWFSAVIQSLFHIPVFRDLILTFQPPPLTNGTTEFPKCVRFVLELEKLFALLVSTERKYINPQLAIQSLKEAFTKGPSSACAQQDVSEFTHKLLEWIEDAFKLSLGKEGGNPVVDLFNGRCKTEGVLDEQPFVNVSEFGAFPVQVQGHSHLHDCLEAATCNPDVQQETWFTHLPPILVVELSRFKYNQRSSQAEKLHNHLTFDRQLYMDRYLEANKVESRERRRVVGQLKVKMNDLNQRLRKFTQYQQKPVSISEVLGLTLNFVRSHDGNAVREEEEEEEGGRAEKRPRTSTYPIPQFVLQEEKQMLEACVTRWQDEVEQDMQGLRESIAETKAALEAVYSDEQMNSTCYHLHSVLVHQGQASGGHYWAYVRKRGPKSHDSPKSQSESDITAEVEVSEITMTDAPSSQTGQTSLNGPSKDNNTSPVSGTDKSNDGREVWLKFNDVSVTEVSWAEVERESFGGRHQNTSAYCLIYINSAVQVQGEGVVRLSQLPLSLKSYVDNDNASFRDEITQYDTKQQERTRPAQLVHVDGEGASGRSSRSSVETVTEDTAAQAGDAKPVGPKHDTSPEHMQIDSPTLPPINTHLIALLRNKVHQKHQQLETLGDGQVVESRIAHIGTYAIRSGAGENVIKAILLQEVATAADANGRTDLYLLAKKDFVSLLGQQGVQRDLDQLRSLYQIFCVICYHCVQAAKATSQRKWAVAVTQAVHAFSLNDDLTRTNPQCAVDIQVVGELRKHALQSISSTAKALFESGEVKQALSLADTLLIPTLKAFSVRKCEGDEEVLENVREEWCQCLMHPSLKKGEQDQLADLLTRMFEECTKSVSLPAPNTPDRLDLPNLTIEYSNTMWRYIMSDM